MSHVTPASWPAAATRDGVMQAMATRTPKAKSLSALKLNTSSLTHETGRRPLRAGEARGSESCADGLRLIAAYLSQFSTLSAGTRLNSETLSVTQIASIARACAAINMSWALRGVPLFSSATRIAA